jgi:hypothetical protein
MLKTNEIFVFRTSTKKHNAYGTIIYLLDDDNNYKGWCYEIDKKNYNSKQMLSVRSIMKHISDDPKSVWKNSISVCS